MHTRESDSLYEPEMSGTTNLAQPFVRWALPFQTHNAEQAGIQPPPPLTIKEVYAPILVPHTYGPVPMNCMACQATAPKKQQNTMQSALLSSARGPGDEDDVGAYQSHLTARKMTVNTQYDSSVNVAATAAKRLQSFALFRTHSKQPGWGIDTYQNSSVHATHTAHCGASLGVSGGANYYQYPQPAGECKKQ